MSEVRRNLSDASDRELEKLLRRAPPRQTPEDAAVEAARLVVHDEWRDVVGQQRRRGFTRWAIAATVLLIIFSVANVYRSASVGAMQVAEIQKSFGAVSIFGPQPSVSEDSSLTTIRSGQTIVTGLKAGMAIARDDGGSIRIDENSKVEFLSGASIFLHTGRVYFDSTPSQLIDASHSSDREHFVVQTAHGVVSHVGTQFMTEVDGESLIVNVREGHVAVDGTYHAATVAFHEQVTFSGHSFPTTSTYPGHGREWAWIAKTSPPIDVEGVTIDQFLNWAGRELGLEVMYAVPDAKQIAMQYEFRGLDVKSSEPRKALELHMATTTLDSRIDGGKINVSISH